jgi:hypothetical protein
LKLASGSRIVKHAPASAVGVLFHNPVYLIPNNSILIFGWFPGFARCPSLPNQLIGFGIDQLMISLACS